MLDLKNEIPEFDKKELLQYTEWTIAKLYNSLKNNKKLETEIKPELVNKLNKERAKYRINMVEIELEDN